MIDDVAWNLLPGYLPESIPPWVLVAFDDAKIEGDRDRLRRAYAWAHRLLYQATGSAISTTITAHIEGTFRPTIADISAGFIPFRNEAKDLKPGTREHAISILPTAAPTAKAKDRNYTFGVVVGIGVDSESGEFPRFVSEPGAFVTLDGDFPLILEQRRIQDDAPPNPAGNATSTCYARPRKNKRFYTGYKWSEGIIIARHVLNSIGTAPGTKVPMADGATTTVADIDAATTIDAAVLDGGLRCIPKSSTPLPISSINLVGSSVSVRCKRGSFAADVLRVMDDPRYFGNLVAHRAFINSHGTSGDSGGLVRYTSNYEAMGIYLGSTGGSPTEGLVQLMRQVSEYFEVDLYD